MVITMATFSIKGRGDALLSVVLSSPLPLPDIFGLCSEDTTLPVFSVLAWGLLF
jgi:hypothetical protein